MRIALTGSASTGKTTLAKHLLKNPIFSKKIDKFITADARQLLRERGFRSTDSMPREQLRQFQIDYFNRKRELELGEDNYLTERSFVDVAAFWVQRDTYDKTLEEQNLLVIPCREESQKYDVHFYAPVDLIKFEPNGYRSEDMEFRRRIDWQIRCFLSEWGIEYVTLDTSDIKERVIIVLRSISSMT